MKSAKEEINEVIKKLESRQKPQNYQLSDSNDTSLSAFDLIPIQFTGMIEDYLFRESRQIFDILKEDTDQDIEGLSYTDIRSDAVKNAYFDKVRLNIPKYYALKISERQKHFELEGELYMKKLGIKPEQVYQNKNEQTLIKKQANIHEPTPMKCAVSKKQALENKKQEKKNNNKVYGKKTQIKKQPTQVSKPKQEKQQRYNTPQKKEKEKKKVKFFEFEYVKDFSQYKTPKRLAKAEQLIEPLKDSEPQQNIQE